eukprot:10887913-Alexandrium_andersonii.AAC.1
MWSAGPGSGAGPRLWPRRPGVPCKRPRWKMGQTSRRTVPRLPVPSQSPACNGCRSLPRTGPWSRLAGPTPCTTAV